MVDVNLSSPIDVRNAGIKALQEALGSVGMVKFMQQLVLMKLHLKILLKKNTFNMFIQIQIK